MVPPFTLVVLARPEDPGLAALARLPEGVRALVTRDPDALGPEAAEAEALLVMSGGAAALERAWRRAPRVRWIHSRPAGVDHLLFPALVASDVVLTNSRGVFSRGLAEFVMAGMHFAKDVRSLVQRQGERRWELYEPLPVRGRTMGVVGFGDIGQAAARLGRAFGMRVLALRRSGAPDPAGLAEAVYGPHGLDALLRESDDVVLATPLTAETRGLLGAARIARLKPTAVVVNVGRGPVIEEAALVGALRERRIRGAALDVFEVEPLPPDHPLWALDNVLVSPHSADRTAGWQLEAMEVFLDNLARYRAGKALGNVVQMRRGY